MTRLATDERRLRIERAIGYRFDDPELLEVALTHRSHAHEGPGGKGHYERLEFLGDALLGFLVSDWLYRDDGSATEGTLSRRRQSVVRTASLAGAAREIGLGLAIHLGRGEEQTGGRDKASLLADTFEAVLGAIYLDGGMRAARAFVRRQLTASLQGTRHTTRAADDYKTQLQEAIQGELRRTPRYRIVTQSGPAHAMTFRAEAFLDDRILGCGVGTTRKQAEQEAARDALERRRRR